MRERVTLFWKRALDANGNAVRATAEETRRALEIVACDWNWLNGKSRGRLSRCRTHRLKTRRPDQDRS
jgi:hypothetical protein